ncbi:MAG: hypothetical protein Q9220_007497 [cf. Caloplaca sp. 1 TL-2023]
MKYFLLLLSTIVLGTGSQLLRQDSSLGLSQVKWGREAAAEQLLHVSIALNIRNADLGAQTLLQISDPNSPEYGRFWSAKDVASFFKPTPETISDVVAWLGESGLNQSRIHISHAGDRLSFDMSVEEATTLLRATLYHQIDQETRQEQIACRSYHIPKSLVGSIDYIHAASPLHTHQRIRRQQIPLNDKVAALAPLPPGCRTQTTLSCMRMLYGIPENISPHHDNSLQVYEPTLISWLPEDLDKFFVEVQKNLVGHRPKVEAVNGGYLQRNFTGPNQNLEPNLDFEYTMALTSPQEVTNVQVAGNLYDMLAAFDRYYCGSTSPGDEKYPKLYPPGCNATTCDCGSTSPPKVLSISWGWTEAGFTPNYLQRQCLEFLKLGLMGTTVVASVSDDGTASDRGDFCIDDETGNGAGGKFSPLFPSSCPWVTAVGGTQMLPPNNPRTLGETTNETAWRESQTQRTLSSGGGFSNVFLAPPYQLPNIVAYKSIEQEHLDGIRSRFNSTGRGFPDVALRADNYLVVSNGNWSFVSGTSASNPVFASIITLINSERMHAGKGSLGFINPVLYGNPDILNDIVTGTNQGCGVDQAFRATRGWDAVTGLGSPNYERMRQYLIGLP